MKTHRYWDGSCVYWHIIVAAAAICWKPLEFIFSYYNYLLDQVMDLLDQVMDDNISACPL